MRKRSALPAASRAVVQQMEEPPPVVLPEDRAVFLAGVETEHQTEAEEAWNNMAEQAESQERQRRQTLMGQSMPTQDRQILLEILTAVKGLTKTFDPRRSEKHVLRTDGWMSTEQAADYLQMTPRGVRVAAENGRLPGHKRTTSKSRGNRWLFRKAELDKYLSPQKKRAVPEISIWQ